MVERASSGVFFVLFDKSDGGRNQLFALRSIANLFDHHVFFFSIDAYATAKHLFERASHPVPNIEISTHSGRDLRGIN
jgi:hypothetical protein